MNNVLKFVVFCAVVAIIAAIVTFRAARPRPRPPAPAESSFPADGFPAPPSAVEPKRESLEKLVELVTPPAGRVEKEGAAVALLIDTSGSMKDKTRDGDGALRTKFEIAKRSARRAIEELREFSAKHPDRLLQVGLYQFSGSSCKRVLPLGAFDPEEAVRAVERMTTGRGTPIGEALLAAKHDLDRSGLTRKHMLVLTDGENTEGRDPVLVAQAIAALAPEEQAGIYFIAFQVEAARFAGIKDAGGTVLAAASPAELDVCLDYVLEQKVLLELPEPPPRR